MKKSLLIIGAGQYGHIAKEIAEDMGCYDKIAFLDDASEKAIGKLSAYTSLADEYTDAFVAIGNSEVRCRWLDQLQAAGYHAATLISPKAYVSPAARIDGGSTVEPMAVVQTNATVAAGCFISSGAVLRHDCVIGEVCHVDCNAVVLSCVTVPPHTHVGCSEVFADGK